MSQRKEPIGPPKKSASDASASKISSTELASTEATTNSATASGNPAASTVTKKPADQKPPSQRRVIETFDPTRLPVDQAEFERDCQRLGLQKGLHKSRHAPKR
ncbi:hypothetical protein F5B20DRAFT_261404 [Whalleya microplaca]|nr:hypothetical protein F5B20DRAFT_261404 [Whalleya microplaca]